MSIVIKVNGRRGNVSPVVYPNKGDIIQIDMDGDRKKEDYLVLKKISDNVVELLSQVKWGINRQFALYENVIYENSDIDRYCESIYNTIFTNKVKNAIVKKRFRQQWWDSSSTGRRVYVGKNKSNQTYHVSLVNANVGNEIARHVYLLSTQDYIDYLGATESMTPETTTLLGDAMNEIFNSTDAIVWSSDKYSNKSINTFDNSRGQLVIPYLSNVTKAVYIAFQIDLSKISWSPYYNMTISGNGDSSYCYVTGADSSEKYYTDGDSFKIAKGNTFKCYVNNMNNRVTLNGVPQTIGAYHTCEIPANDNYEIALSFALNDYSYIDITTV